MTKLNPSGSALVYSTFLGGSGGSGGHGIAVDSAGNAYVTGSAGLNFPTTPGAFQTTYGGDYNAFVTKFNPTGSALVYSTYLGGSGGSGGTGIAVDSSGNAYVTGSAGADFPTTPGAFQTTCCGAFVTKFNPAGTALVYSTYLDDGYGYGIAVDSAGNAYVTGSATADFPTTPAALLKKCNHGKKCPTEGTPFVAKLNNSGSALVYSTYLGGWNGNFDIGDAGYGITVDSSGNAYLTGVIESNNFPVTPGAFQTTCNSGNSEAFVTKILMLAATTTILSSSPNPSAYGDPVTFTAVVNSLIGAPFDGETVSFLKGTTVLGTGTLSSGSARFTTSALKVGTTSVTAVYGGDLAFAGSKSKPVKQVVEK